MVHEGRVGPHRLPKNTIVLASTNRAEDLTSHTEMIMPFQDRFDFILDIEPDLEVWKQDFAYNRKIDPCILAFLSVNPEYFYRVQPGIPPLSPRAWEKIHSNVHEIGLTEAQMDLAHTNRMGVQAAAAYKAFKEIRKNLPDEKELWNLGGFKFNQNDLNLVYTITSMFVYAAKKFDDKLTEGHVLSMLQFVDSIDDHATKLFAFKEKPFL